jgi:hypothetical protein
MNPGLDEAVTSINNLTGDVILAAGTGITLTPAGQTITIASATDLSGYLKIDGSTTGATSQIQQFTNGIKTGILAPITDSTTALQIMKANGTTPIATWDTTNGRLGIGTTTPTYNLDVTGTGRFTGVVTAQGGSFGGSSLMSLGNLSFNNGDVIKINDPALYDLSLWMSTGGAAATSKVTFKNDGNVGIGTTSPGAKLEVAGKILINGSSATNNGEIKINNTDTGGGQWRIGDGIGAAAGVFTIYDAKNSLLPLVINSSGNVGIGTTSPSAYLNIKAGVASAGGAPFKLTAGTDLATAETGAMEYDGTNLHFTPTGTLRENIHLGSKGSATLTAGTTTTITTAGAKATSVILIQPTSASLTLLGIYVSAKNAGSFVLTHGVAAGTESFDWVIIN